MPPCSPCLLRSVSGPACDAYCATCGDDHPGAFKPALPALRAVLTALLAMVPPEAVSLAASRAKDADAEDAQSLALCAQHAVAAVSQEAGRVARVTVQRAAGYPSRSRTQEETFDAELLAAGDRASAQAAEAAQRTITDLLAQQPGPERELAEAALRAAERLSLDRAATVVYIWSRRR